MKIMVTGHKGYIGNCLFSFLLNNGYDVHGIDLKDGDDILYCLPDGKYDYVFHMAAYPKVEYSMISPTHS